MFQFNHESVDAVTITDDDGNSRTYVDAERIAEVMLNRLDALAASVVVDVMTNPNPESLLRLGNAEGQVEAYSFVAGFTRHLNTVSGRLQAGLPAHEDDTLSEAEIDAQAEQFAALLNREVTPEDFTG